MAKPTIDAAFSGATTRKLDQRLKPVFDTSAGSLGTQGTAIRDAIVTCRTALQALLGTSGTDASGVLTRVPTAQEQAELDEAFLQLADHCARIFRSA